MEHRDHGESSEMVPQGYPQGYDESLADWVEAEDDTGTSYFWNRRTGVSTWHAPLGWPVGAQASQVGEEVAADAPRPALM